MVTRTVPAYHLIIEEPPEPFAEEFPLVSNLAMLEYNGKICLYVPEDDEFITNPTTVLRWLHVLMPIIKFGGGCQVTITESEPS